MPPTLLLEKAYGWPGKLIAGVDEAGRGALAGPVVAAGVIFSASPPPGIDDSKKLAPHVRARLAKEIKDCACVGIGVVSPQRIDEINILQAALEAMAQALAALPQAPTLALIDGTHAPQTPTQCKTITKGDSRSLSIAAASIIAKTHRDGLMQALAATCPGYGLEQNMGYPTKAHRNALMALGVSKIHRRSYRPVRAALTSP